MITAHACIPCLTRHIVDCVDRLALDADERRDQLLRSCLQVLTDADYRRSPPAIAQLIQRRLRRLCGNDPFAAMKQETREMALSLLPALQTEVATAKDSLALAVRFAAAGNLIDAGLVHDTGRTAVEQALAESREAPLDRVAIDTLRARITQAERILYLADNAGELVFDRLLLELLPQDRLTLVVRGGPVLNDATLEDVTPSGVPTGIAVMDNGSDAPGTLLDECSAEMRSHFGAADLVFSKGQGNFETLQGVAAPIFFILKAKCPVVAELLSVPLGSIVARFAG